MPQMFPLNWILLFLIVILLFYLTMIKLFFWGTPKPQGLSEGLLLSHTSNKWMW